MRHRCSRAVVIAACLSWCSLAAGQGGAPDSVTLLDFENGSQFTNLQTDPLTVVEPSGDGAHEGRGAAKLVYSAVPDGSRQYPAVVLESAGLAAHDFTDFEAISLWVRNPGEAAAELCLSIRDSQGNRSFPNPSRVVVEPGEWQHVVARLVLHGLDAENIGSLHFYQNINREPVTLLIDDVKLLSPQAGRLAARIQAVAQNLARARNNARALGAEEQIKPQIDGLDQRLQALKESSRKVSRGSERTGQLLELAQLVSESQALTSAAAITMEGRRITFVGPGPQADWLANEQLVRGLEIVRMFDTSIGDDVFARLEPADRLINFIASGRNLTMAGMEKMTSDRLRVLFIDGTSATDNGLEHVRKFSRLEKIRLSETNVTSGVLKHFAELGRLTDLVLDDTAVADAGFDAISALKTLNVLSLARTNITGESLAHVKELTRLQTLDLQETAIDDAGIASLSSLFELQTLRLANTRITGASFEALEPLDKLTLLQLGGTRVDDAAIRRLGAVPKLSRLELSSTRITDGSLQHITRSARLNYLDVYGTNVTDAGFAHLKGQRGIQQLYAGGTGLSDVGLESLAAMNRMTHLDLSGTQITDAGLQHLGAMKNLVVLRLANTQLTGEGLQHLAGLSKLQLLDLSGTSVDDRAMASIRPLGNLRQLFLGGTRVTDDGMSRLKAARLVELNLEATEVGDTGIAALAELPGLRQLNINETSITDAAARHLAAMPRLQSLSVNRTAVSDDGLAELGDRYSTLHLAHTRITDRGVEQLQKNDQLTELNLAATGITDRALGLLRATPNLRQLDLSQTGISDTGLQHLTVLPELADLNLNGTHVSDAGLEALLEMSGLQQVSLENSRVSAQGASWLRRRAPALQLELIFPWKWGERWSYYPLRPDSQPSRGGDTDELLQQLRELTSLGYLHIDGSLLTPKVLRSLKDLPTLEHLSFAGTDLADDMLKHLLGLSQVVRLDLSDTPLTDAGLVHLQDMQGLRELNLQGTSVTGSGLRFLTNLQQLQELGLSRTPLLSAGLEHVARFEQLRKLELSTTDITDAAIAQLTQLPRLEYLDLYGTQITDKALQHLASMPALRYCYLTDTRITDVGAQQLPNLADLEELAIDGTQVTDAGLIHLENFINLQALRIGRTQVTENGLQHLTGLPKLKSLGLAGLPISDTGVASLRPLSSLESLDLAGTTITDAALGEFEQFPVLTALDLRDTAVSKDAVDEFALNNPEIQVLTGITDTGYSAWSLAITALYAIVVLAICIYGFHRYWLAWLFLRDKQARTSPVPPGHFDELPLVTVQLPMFNERHVAERIIEAVCAFDYPRDRLQIQVLDDSTDESGRIAQTCCHRYSEAGHNVDYLHRSNREGFKGGALAAGMESATGEFIAIFDADFVPPPDILHRMVHHFTDDRIGMVQAEWSHLNRDESLLTECQAMFLDGHFVVEQTVRSRRGLWFNFNGTAGLWRRACIAEAGGWDHDTLTEDTDLSYRAQLAGWKFRYLPTVTCDAELPSTVTAFLGQQHRWTKGLIQNSKKILPRILFSSASWRIKLEAWFHLTAPVMYLVMFLLTAIALPALFLETPLNHWQSVSLGLGLATLGLGTFAAATFYVVSQRGRGRSLVRTLLTLPALMALGIGICAVNARAVIEALLGFRSPFVRTPKFGGRTDAEPDAAQLSRGLRIPTGLVELALGGVLFGCLVMSLFRPYTLIGAPFLLLFAAGYVGVGICGLLDRYGSRSRRKVPDTAEDAEPVKAGVETAPVQNRRPRLSVRGIAVTAASILFTAAIAGAMFVAAAPQNTLAGVSAEPAALGLDLTIADWQIVGEKERSAIKRVHAERGSLVLDVRIDETNDQGEIALNLEGALKALGATLTTRKEIVFEVEYPARFTGEFQVFAKDADYNSEYGPFEVVESFDRRRAATVALVPGPRVPPMGYKDPDFRIETGIRQLGLKISAQSDRVRGVRYRPFRGSITVRAIGIRDVGSGSEPEILVTGTAAELTPTPADRFREASGVDSPWPLGYAFSGPLTEAHGAALEKMYAAVARRGCRFTRVYLGDYRTGLMFDGKGQIVGVDPAFLEYVDGLAEIANRHGITVMFSLTDNTMADGRGLENPEFIADRHISRQFIDGVIVKFVEKLADRDVIWDVFNEPENVTGIPLRVVQRYVDRVLTAARAADPDARLTVVSRSRADIVYWQGRGLNLYSHNIFTKTHLAEATEASRSLDAPIMVAEMAPILATADNLESLRNAGYTGVGIWGLGTTDKYAWTIKELNGVTSPLVSMGKDGD